MISDGRPDVHVGVLYHAEADWSGGNYQPCERIGRMLTEAQVDHHFIPADVFEERARYGTRIDTADKCLHIGNGTYHVFLIPEADFLSLSAAQGIAEMQSAGIPVLSLGPTPDAVCSGERAVPLCGDAGKSGAGMQSLGTGDMHATVPHAALHAVSRCGL